MLFGKGHVREYIYDSLINTIDHYSCGEVDYMEIKLKLGGDYMDKYTVTCADKQKRC